MKICPKCQTNHYKPGIFCSRSCANSREWSEESKKKKSKALKEFIQNNPSWHEKREKTNEARLQTLKTTLYSKNEKKFLEGKIITRNHIKKWLIKTCGEKCSICNLPPLWNGEFLSLQVDHINGINDDNRPDNVRLVCPNCHSQTDTFAGKKHKRIRS